MDRSATTDPLVGRLLDGRYRVGAKIARGGMATVYEATDLRLDRLVAIKVMPDALADNEEFSQRFVREARAAARLAHPNVVAVFDQGDDHGTLFLAMEYVAGRLTLRDVVRDQAPLPAARALALFEEILKAIAAAHESGIIHRDVKPENVLIDPRGRVKVADFGLARAISSTTTATATGGVLMGTVAYLAPELVTEGRSDARSDVYALGVLLYELLTGAKPHHGDSPIQVAYKHVHENVPRPSRLVDGIPPYLDTFIARATSRERDLRPADAHVMLQQLKRVRHAIERGVPDDQELTDDLTPTVVVAQPSRDEVFDILAFESDDTPTTDPDDVFDFAAYDDDFNPSPGSSLGRFAGPDFVLPAHDRTLVVPTERRAVPHDTVESPVDAGRAIAARAPAQRAPAATARSRRRNKGGWIALVVVLLLAAGAATAGWYYGVGRYSETPNVVSLSQDDARQELADSGLSLDVSAAVYSETVPRGYLVSTDPAPGVRVLDGGTVEAVVSKGPERHEVPDLAGLSEAAAIKEIEASALTAAEPERQWSETVARGDVIEFHPRAATMLRRDDPVQLVVSRGPRPIGILDYTGEPADTAGSRLTDAGFAVERVRRYHDDVDKGVVIGQRPDRGTGQSGDAITLVVSRGPRLVEVPDVDSVGVA
ncbi:MAG: protein kinase, partial [Actinomycetota bacterium]|nr:protein kinase [Actinomycetota bacterium]